MAKIPFDIKYRPQIESGEYKVETRDGRKARIIHWDLNCTSPIVAVMDVLKDTPGEIVDVFCVSGRAFDDLESPSDLFIVTPEEELTEFENRLCEILDSAINYQIHSTHEETIEDAKKLTPELLALAREQFIKDGYVIEKKAFHDEVENISDKHRAEMSVEYSLHCKIEDGTRHAIMNWDTFQKVAQKFINIGKVEALKDLPRWRKCADCTPKPKYSNEWIFSIDSENVTRESAIVHKGYFLPLDGLEKLPGFKED